MTGGFNFSIDSKDYKLDFTVMRKITIISGDSATGKSEICRIINDEKRTHEKTVRCKYPVKVLDDNLISVIYDNVSDIFAEYPDHKTDEKQSQKLASDIKSMLQILRITECLYFIDEDVSYVNTKEISAFFKYAPGFFVIISRDLMRYIPRSIVSAFEMKASGKYHELVSINEE